MFRKHPLRDFMLFLVLGITVTFGLNIQAGSTGTEINHSQVIRQ